LEPVELAAADGAVGFWHSHGLGGLDPSRVDRQAADAIHSELGLDRFVMLILGYGGSVVDWHRGRFQSSAWLFTRTTAGDTFEACRVEGL
jgi:proteasome lid subunit RPN8/RPN11